MHLNENNEHPTKLRRIKTVVIVGFGSWLNIVMTEIDLINEKEKDSICLFSVMDNEIGNACLL